MKKTVLIVEDAVINRKVLNRILSVDYEVIEAENGSVAMDILEKEYKDISAMVLDLQMPVMNGYEVMDRVHGMPEYRNIPIIVTTGNNDRENELRALRSGAWDFVAKPYDADILKFRLKNAILRSKINLLEQLKIQAETDELTGLYNEKKFYSAVRKMIDEAPDNKYVMVRFDVDRFKQFNSLFGVDEGDRFLCYVADLLRNSLKSQNQCAYARIESDVFAICQRITKNTNILKSIEIAKEKIKGFSKKFDIVTVYGIYYIEDNSLSVNEMTGRATIAARTCKGNYLKTVAEYTDIMGKTLEREQRIINEMNSALADEQFCVYYQPKYNISTNRPCGAEALVRWNHPEKGMIPPGMFIPVFERNGFVAKVDYFVWERTCRNLKMWVDDGLSPDPISVNISRVNLSNPQIVEMITDLVNKYGIEPRLLQLEITESAYMDNPDIMDKVVDNFHKNGFTILMDDFGSGYSSLNTLKEISVDILKIDMKFLPQNDSNSKSEKILSSIIRMADWIGMPVICEGVETAEQRDFLNSVGCLYVQGYLYSRPIPESDYEKLLAREYGKTVVNSTVPQNENSLSALLSADKNIETLMRSIAIPVAIYSYTGGKFDRIRANQSYFDAFGHSNDGNKIKSRVSPNDAENITTAFNMTVSTKGNSDCEALFIMDSGVTKWFRLNMRYITETGTGHIICTVYTEITAAKRVEAEMTRIVGILNENYGTSKRTMLVVDDSDVSRALLNTMFSHEFSVLEAQNGREAVELLRTNVDEISVILLDMIMPEMDGSEFLAIKTRMDSAARIPVIIISAEDSENVQVNMLRSGVNDYITKPFVPEVVYQRVHNVLEYQSRFEELIKEYRAALSLSPEIGSHLTNLYLSTTEARMLISFMTPIFDVVRIVDPKSTSVITIKADGKIDREPYTCFRVWKKETRCENCSSMCALEENCQMTKYEFIENNVFYVVSRPITLVHDDGEPERVVLEIVSHVSDSVLSTKHEGVSIKEAVEKTRRQIYCDPLTDAYNRRYLYDMLFANNSHCKSARGLAVVMMDINNFKKINDSFGHIEGDRILVESAKAIRLIITDADALVRYGGDEYIILLTGRTRDEAEACVNRISYAVSGVTTSDGTMKIGAEFGYSYTDSFDKTRDMLDSMIEEADIMMYKNKKR